MAAGLGSRCWRAAVSRRTTAFLMVWLGEWLLVGLLVPQTRQVGVAEVAARVQASPVQEFFLVTLGLADLPTSPVFVASLAAFFVHLVCVLGERAAAVWRRVRLRDLSVAQLEARLAQGPVMRVAAPGADAAARAASILRRLGYTVLTPAPALLWAVKHRAALLGFVLMHASFLVLAAGGVCLYYTRFVATVVLVEGQTAPEAWTDVSRHAPAGDPRPLPLTVLRVTPELEQRRVTAAAVRLRFADGEEVEAGVNQPAERGATAVLLHGVGLAPVLRLEDGAGFLRDRVSVIVDPQSSTVPVAPLLAGTWTAAVQPAPDQTRLPVPEALGRYAFYLTARRGDEVAAGPMLRRAGESIDLADGGRLTLEAVRYWARLSVVDERGGAALVVGFLLLVAGAAWRLLWYRREIALAWRDGQLCAVGLGELFPRAFAAELAALLPLLGEAVADREEKVDER